MATGTPQQSVDQYVGARLRQMREAHAMNLADVGGRIGATVGTVEGYERGEERPLPADLISLAELYGVRLTDLFPEDPAQLTGHLH